MTKILKLILGTIFIYLSIYWLGGLAVEILIHKNITLAFPLSNIFFDGERKWFVYLTILATFFELDLLYNIFFSKSKDKDKSEKKNKDKTLKNRYSYLATTKEMKRGLLCVEFEGKGLDTHFATNTWRDKRNRMLNPFHKFHNFIIKPFACFAEEKYKLPTVKHWKIDGKDVIKRSGLPIITKKGKVWVDAGDTHNLIIGTTSSGKTWSLVLLMIELTRMAGESIVINDPKGELYKYTAEKFKHDGYEVRCINFVDPEKSDCWNPLQIAIDAWEKADEKYEIEMEEWREAYEKADIEEKKRLQKVRPVLNHAEAIEKLEDIAATLTEGTNDKDKQWNDFAKDMIKGFGALLLEEGDMELVNFKSIQLLQTLGDETIGKESTILKEYLKIFRKPDDSSAMALGAYTDAKGNTKGSMLSVFKQKLGVLTANEMIMRMTSTNNFDLKDLGNKKMAIYLIVHDEKSTYYQLVTIFIKQLYEVLIKTARDEENLRLSVPVNLVLDEFGACPALKDIDKILAAARSRGVRLTMIVQDFEQLVNNYGKSIAELIQGNVMNLVYILSGSLETVEKISRLCGKERVWVKSEKRYEEKPVLSTERLQRFGLGEAVFKRQRWNPYLTRLLPYDKYPFYTGMGKENNDIVLKPEAKYFDIKQ